ncbi:RNA 3'-terminal phosphate cyclase [Aliikangiella marina]|uniref:RNA 3'-terminal phosphate cyclase n=1 Tax=Aliikangiella marina TaxID=1712262 RepID=A0A545TCK3_9GAMM|nr:RNA 3'-terminal phosphate cyclase [Aliikangiella marina]TQV74953.1 RNA 3'-terminal phosphate cyclase [Aliikangiella marina]
MKKEFLTINGSQGEGGGQILRTSLSLSMCLGVPIRIENIRAGRQKPGLLRQHLTCVRAAQEICDATVEGDELRSNTVEFIPRKVKQGNYRFSIGTAGSTTLVFQTILPALLLADDISEVQLEGGTHNQSAPSYEFIKDCFLKSVEMLGVNVEHELHRYGFYPNGGGNWQAKIHPAKIGERLKLLERGEPVARSATTFTAKIPQHVSRRELNQVVKKLRWNLNDLQAIEVDSFGPGNIVSLQAAYANSIEQCESVAQWNVRAEKVADKAIKQLQRFVNSKAVVGEYLADQLLLPMVLLTGGSFVTYELSQHVRTNIDVINQFVSSAITIEEIDECTNKIIVKGLNLASR